MKWLMVVGLLGGFLVGCASQPIVEYKSVPKEAMPPPPQYIPIPGSSLQCLDEDTYTILVKNQANIVEYAKALKRLIEATQE